MKRRFLFSYCTCLSQDYVRTATYQNAMLQNLVDFQDKVGLLGWVTVVVVGGGGGELCWHVVRGEL